MHPAKNRPCPAHVKTAGFTLIELILVIIVLGLLSSSALSIVPQDMGRVGWARQLVGDLRLAQSYSMNRGSDHRLIRTTVSSYEIRDAIGTVVPASQVSVPDVTFTAFDVPFDRQGQPINGATVITVTDINAQTSTITILATTGLVQGP